MQSKKARLRVYVAGAYSADNVLDVLNNMRIGMKVGTALFVDGYAPFVPWFDYHFQLISPLASKLTTQDYYEYSLAWLEVSDCLFVINNELSKKSKGVNMEIERAIELNIPVLIGWDDFNCYVEGLK